MVLNSDKYGQQDSPTISSVSLAILSGKKIIPKVFRLGMEIQIRAFGRPVINEYNVSRPEEIHIVPSCMACGIIMPKKSDIDIILKQWDYVPRKNFISAALGPDQDRITVYSQNDLV